jgi:imidazolonepropionase-like amidohydrolase
VHDAVVVVGDGIIVAVGTADEVVLPEGAERVEAPGSLLIPGFIDAHVHIGFYDPRDVLLGGVTTVRDLAWPPERIHALARDSLGEDFCGPRILAAGPMLTVAGGYPTRARWAPDGTGRVVNSPADAETAVDATATEGAVVIKVALNPEAGPTLDPPLLRAIVGAAHARELEVTAHVSGLDELDKAIDAGVDELAHMLMSPERIPPEMIARMVSQDMVVIPTLSILSGRERAIAIDNLRRFIAAGGRVVYGTDLGNEGPRPGIDPREVEGMRASGMSTRDIVAAATVGAAAHLGLDRVGVIEAGYQADIAAVPVAALEDPIHLADVQMVFRRGRTC